MGRITFDELEARLADPDLPDAAIRPYLVGAAGGSSAFAPLVLPDRERVATVGPEEARATSLDLVGWANRWSRWRRQQRFLRRLEAGETASVLVSEGDSWFQFPLLLDDTIDQLSSSYLIWSLDSAGDTLAAMTGPEQEYAAALGDPRFGGRVRGLLLSAGGNDVIGSEPGPDGRPVSVLETLLRPRPAGGDPLACIDEAALAERLDRIERGHALIIETVAWLRPGVPVLCHGYAHAVPAFPGDPRRPSWARHGAWLAEPLARRGIVDPADQRRLVAELIDRLYLRLGALCGGGGGGGRYPWAWLVDARPALGPGDWADEIHPTDAAGRGFAAVAERFRAVIEEALAAAPAA